MPSEFFAPLLPANDIASPDATPPHAEDALFHAAAPSDIRDLIEAPCRSLELEYKSWRNLDHPEDRAELARDIAALANHGGGFVIFGFNETTLLPDETDPHHTNCTANRVVTIVQTYLDPPVRCDVATVISAAGILHPVIRVASHGTTPVCVRQDGPSVGGVRLIERGAFYIRTHGTVRSVWSFDAPPPQSSKVEAPHDWAPLIRRCVRRDREALMGMLEATIEGRSAMPDITQRLHTWHRATHAMFLSLVPRSPSADLLVRRHYALSYGLDLARPEMLEHAQLPERLRRIVFELQSQFRSGWNMFDPPYRRGVQARFLMDPACGDPETDFLETAWLRARIPGDTADFWRVSPRGLASIVRGYAEDMPQPATAPPIHPGCCLSPELLAQEVAELVCHARALARLFATVRRVAFRCEWWGLSGRELFDREQRLPYRGPALGDHGLATAHVPVSRLAEAWPEVVAQLIAPVLRAFETDLVLDADWVRRQAPRWAVPPT